MKKKLPPVPMDVRLMNITATVLFFACGLPEGEEAAIQEIVLRAYRVLGCRGWGRLDVMIDGATRKPYLLEINTSPGMTGHSLVPMSARAAGISYEDLCVQLLAMASLDQEQATQRIPPCRCRST